MTAKSPDRPGRRPAALARALSLALPAVLALLAAVSCGKKAEDESAWKSFEILMNATFGEGGWTAASHSFDTLSSALTVTGIECDLSHRPQALPPEYEGLLTGKARMESLTVTGILETSRMAEAAKATSWRGRPETVLARSLSMKGLTAPLGSGEFVIEASADSVELADVKLRANSDPAPAQGETDMSLLNSLELGSLSKKGIRISVRFPSSLLDSAANGAGPLAAFAASADEASGGGAGEPGGGTQANAEAGDVSSGGAADPDASVPERAADPAASADRAAAPSGPQAVMEMTLASFEGRGMGFAPMTDTFPMLPPLMGIIMGQKASSLAWTDLKVTVTGLPGRGDSAVTVASAEVSGLENLGKSQSAKLLGLKADMAESPSGAGAMPPLSLGLDSLEAVGLDLNPAAAAYMPAIVAAIATGDPSEARKAKSMAEYLVDPYTYDSVSFQGAYVDFSGIRIASANFARTGPIVAWTLSPNKTELSAHVTLTGEPGTTEAGNAQKFQDLFGMTDFGVRYGASLEVTPDGGWKYSMDELEATGMAKLSGTVGLTGITQEMVDGLREINADEPDPLALLGLVATFGIEGLTASLDDAGLTRGLIKLESQNRNETPERVKSVTVENMGIFLADQLGMPARAFGPFLDTLAGFLDEPGRIALAVQPGAPLTMTTFTPFLTANDLPGLMDFINVTLQTGDSPPVRFLDRSALTASPPEEPEEADEPVDVEDIG